MSGIKCISNIVRTTSRIAKQAHLGTCRGFSTDITHSRRALCALTGINWNTDVLGTKVTKKSISKFSYNSSVALGCLSTMQPLLIETSDGSSGDMLDCLGGDEDSDTWSYM